MTLLLKNKTGVKSRSYQSFRLVLEDWSLTTVHVARYKRGSFRPRLKLFSEETNLLDWCEENKIQHAMVGGFFLRKQNMPLGDLWISGQEKQTVPYLTPWNDKRGAVYVDESGKLRIAPRYMLPQSPRTDLLQAGPLLVQGRESVIKDEVDPEGFSAGAVQFDSDITDGRYPRAAIGVNDNYIFSVVCDGRTSEESGLTLKEFADVLVEIGVSEALNVDGGSSATLIGGGKLLNKPRGGHDHGYALFERGRPVFSAIVFESLEA
jgi:hypothetical protein